MQTTNNNIIKEIISTAKLVIAGTAEFEPGDNLQIFSELYLQPLLKKMNQGLVENPIVNHKDMKEFICTITAVELELQRILEICKGRLCE